MLFAQASSLHSIFSHPSLIVLFPSRFLLLRTLHLEHDLVVYFTWTQFHSCPLVVQLLSCVRLLWPHGPQHTRLLCPSLSPGVCSDSCPLSRWCHPTISSSVALFSSCPPSFPASGSFPMSLLFAWGCQSIGVLVLAMNIRCWLPLGLTGLISLLSKGLTRVFFQYSLLSVPTTFFFFFLIVPTTFFRFIFH